jgi:sulfur-carrier protein
MPVTIHLSGHLKAFADGAVEVELSDDLPTVAAALDSLWLTHPALRDRVLTETGEIRPHVNIFAGEGDVKRMKGLETKLSSRHLHIFNAVSGG